MPGTGPQLFGCELDPAEPAIAVSARDGQTVVTDVPASDTELISAINVIECADLDSAMMSAVGDVSDPAAGSPYLLLVPIGRPPAAVTSDRELIAEVEAWRRELDAQGRYVMGSSLGGIEAADTQRLRDARTLSADSPFNQVEDLIITLEVVLAADRRQAITVAAAYPLARSHAVEVRPFGTAR